MKKLALLLVLLPLYVHGVAPFGLKWGDDVSLYEEAKHQGDDIWVQTQVVPKALSIAEHYLLSGDAQHGLLQVTMTSYKYGVHADELNDDFQIVKQSLIKSGYLKTDYVASELSSYQCVLQGTCSGKRWYAIDEDGTYVALEQVAKTRQDAYIKMTFKSPELMEIEAEREELKQLKQQDKLNSDKLAFD
ncbi:hypothetical protein ACNPKB_07780 [Shewanella marisflavi]|uniref:hypothetical protein n=1 Tax=Shewanella marisflavi TaxID=260364 RepID=UPI003AAE8BDD